MDDTNDTRDAPLTDGRLMRDVCRYFVPALLELTNPDLARSLVLEDRQTLSPEVLDELRADVRFENSLIFCAPYPDQSDEEIRQFRRTLIVAFVFLGEPEIDDLTAERLFHHTAHFFVEEQLRTVPHAVFLRQGPDGAGKSAWKDEVAGIQTFSFQCPAFGLEGARAADWLTSDDEEHSDERRTAAVLFAPFMSPGDWSGPDFEQRLRQALDDAPVDDGRRRMLRLLLDRKLNASPDAEREIHRLLYEARPMPAPDIASIEALIDHFFGDLLTLVGRRAVDGLDFRNVITHGDLPGQLPDVGAGLSGGVPLCERLTEIAHRDNDTNAAVVYLVVGRKRTDDFDERLSRRTMQLRLHFPGQAVIPFALFMQRSTGEGCCICQYNAKHGDDVLVRLRYYAFSIDDNGPEDFLKDPRPVAWALASMMSAWDWSRGTVVLKSLMKILDAQTDLEPRQALWDFVRKHMDLDTGTVALVDKELRDYAKEMRKTVIEYLDGRLRKAFPADLREALQQTEDPMEIYQLIEDVYEKCVDMGLIPEDAISDAWPVN